MNDEPAKNTVLILTREDDEHARDLSVKLRQRGGQVVTFNPALLPGAAQLIRDRRWPAAAPATAAGRDRGRPRRARRDLVAPPPAAGLPRR